MQSVKRSFFWSAIEQVGPQVVGFVVSVILARQLDPSDYGLIGMLSLFIALAGAFTNFGLSAALVQRKNVSADDETSVFALNVAASLVLAGILCAISPLVAAFYNQRILIPLLCVQSLSVVISSLGLVQGALMLRKMEFHKTAVISLVCSILSGIVGVSMAYAGYGVWSLIGSGLTAAITSVTLYWYLGKWRPTGSIRLSSIASMWGFSAYLLGCSLIGVVFQNLYSIIIGKVYSPADLGYYNRANSLRMLPAGTMSGIVGRVAFPLFSKHQDDKELLLRKMRGIFRGTLFISAGGLALLAVIADPLIPWMLTEKWRPAIPLLRILCYAGMFYPLHTLYLMTLQAIGHSNLNFRLESIKMVLGLITVLSVYRFGVTALAWSVVGLTLIAYFLNAWYNVKLLEYRWRLQAFDILPTFALCAIAGGAAWWMGRMVDLMPIAVMLIQVATFAVFLGLGGFLFRNIFFIDVWEHLTWGSVWLRQRMAQA